MKIRLAIKHRPYPDVRVLFEILGKEMLTSLDEPGIYFISDGDAGDIGKLERAGYEAVEIPAVVDDTGDIDVAAEYEKLFRDPELPSEAAPACDTCGSVMVRCASFYKCTNCGETMPPGIDHFSQ